LNCSNLIWADYFWHHMFILVFIIKLKVYFLNSKYVWFNRLFIVKTNEYYLFTHYVSHTMIFSKNHRNSGRHFHHIYNHILFQDVLRMVLIVNHKSIWLLFWKERNTTLFRFSLTMSCQYLFKDEAHHKILKRNH
jgi:hypothetical protein